MIDVKQLTQYLKSISVDFYTGVPDSLLSSFCDYIEETPDTNNVIVPNEGNAVALAAGHYLSTGKYSLVYMQNSGLGNAINPITSLTHKDVYSIPVVYLIGWRGEPGIKDEPQHKKQGKITPKLLKLLDIDFKIIKPNTTIEDIKNIFEDKFIEKLRNNESVALLVSKNSFKKYSINHSNDNPMSREEAINVIVSYLGEEDVIVSTTGKASRELFECRENNGSGHSCDFLTVGSMGHSSSIALGISENTDKNVFVFDGDGAILMHMGSLALIGTQNINNFHHILFNNSAHESVGGLPTIMNKINITEIAENCGYHKTYYAGDKEELENILPSFLNNNGRVFLLVDVNLLSRGDLGRPTRTPIENKIDFIKQIRGE